MTAVTLQNPQKTALAPLASPVLEPSVKGLEAASRAIARMAPSPGGRLCDFPETALASPQKCQAILETLDAVKPPHPGDPAHAAAVAKCLLQLLGAYPSRKIADPEAYRAAIQSLLWEYPALVCHQAIDRITRSSTFLPSRAELATALSEADAAFTRLRCLAKAHLEERKRRETAALTALPPPSEAELAANRERVRQILDKFFNRAGTEVSGGSE